MDFPLKSASSDAVQRYGNKCVIEAEVKERVGVRRGQFRNSCRVYRREPFQRDSRESEVCRRLSWLPGEDVKTPFWVLCI